MTTKGPSPDNDRLAMAGMFDLQAGDIAGISKIHEAYAPHLSGYIGSILHSPEATEDVLHDVYVKVMTKGSMYDDDRLFSWLLKIARNTSIDYMRKNHPNRSLNLEAVEFSAENNYPYELTDPATIVSDRSVIRYALGELTDRQRQAVHNRAVLGLSLEETAEEMGATSKVAVDGLYHRGRVAFRKSVIKAQVAPKVRPRKERLAA